MLTDMIKSIEPPLKLLLLLPPGLVGQQYFDVNWKSFLKWMKNFTLTCIDCLHTKN